MRSLRSRLVEWTSGATASTLTRMPATDSSTTPLLSILLFAGAAVAGAVGQFLYKSGAEVAGRAGSWTGYLNWRLLAGVVCYVAVMVAFVAAFRRGGSLATLYPVYASTFIVAAFIGWWAYGEPVKPVNAGGMVLLVAGMYLMGR